ncbi:MAG TPA: acyltransferase [Pseudolabrys sp.]|jgi:peptidoglycan/LPS O-acetylase OafA/YrhL
MVASIEQPSPAFEPLRVVAPPSGPNAVGRPLDRVSARDAVIDTLRGIAILMVIGIHSLPKPDGSALVTAVDAALRPCVPVFLFASGYLSAPSAHIPVVKRIMRALGPYTIAFVAAYLFIAAENPLMDHRPAIIAARYSLAYVFVYYYVFVYVGCSVLLWLVFEAANGNPAKRQPRLIVFLSLSIVIGLAIGAYLAPLLRYFGVPGPAVEEVRMRDLPFWFGFMALGVIVGRLELQRLLQDLRIPLLAVTVAGYAGYVSVRVFGIGDAAGYDSIAFFVYAAFFCLGTLAFAPNIPALSFLGSASYAIYLWHIFAIMVLRDLLAPHPQPVAAFFIEYGAALASSAALVLAVRSLTMPRLAQWLGA